MSNVKATKKLLNTVERCVDDNLEGLVALNPGLRILKGHRVVLRCDYESLKVDGKVAVLSGGGSGHEPTHAGFIGPGMLTGAIAGSVFASPPPNSILAAIRAVGKNNSGGVLMVVKNYTGDRINFGIALERASRDGVKVAMVVVNEDCALTSTDKTAGRRGLCGTLFVHKIAGALADDGKSLEEIVQTCNHAIKDMGTLGLCLSPCSLPGSGPSFTLGPDEMELGLGVHGEAGVKRLKILPAHQTVQLMLDHMTNPDNVTHMALNNGDSVAVLINNLGGTSVLEQNIVAKETISQLEKRGVAVDRAFAGHFITSLEMAGFSISVLKLDDTRQKALDADTRAPAWPHPLLPQGVTTRTTPSYIETEDEQLANMTLYDTGVQVTTETSGLLQKAIKAACDQIIANEETLNKMDSQSGDGDCGSSLKSGAQAILLQMQPESCPERDCLPFSKPNALLLTLASIIEQSMGGSSGAMYSLFLTAAANQLMDDVSAVQWVKALEAGNNAIAKYGGAEPGDRTMLDALDAAYQCLSKNIALGDPPQAMKLAAKAAEDMAQKTTDMKARAGRASYVHSDNLTQPDPGAFAVAIWFRALSDKLC